MSEADIPLVLTPEARIYALKELARRAGVTREFFLSWQIEVTNHQTSISFASGQPAQIHIEHASPALLQRLAAGDFPVVQASCLPFPGRNAGESPLILPFCDVRSGPHQPLFQRSADSSFLCSADILLATLFTLCRTEETICSTRDEHLRFPASASLAARHNFLERPIVDEYGAAFEQVLSALRPLWKRARQPLRTKLTHDIDLVGIPFSLQATVGHTLKRKNPACTARDILAAASSTEPTDLYLVRKLAQISKSRGLHSAFYWKGSPRTPMDEGYDPFHPKVQRVLRDLQQQDFELGVHPGYDTFHARAELSREADRLREALGVKYPGGRQHYLRWSPATWLDWEACGLRYDSSVGFADQLGFRAGTSVPYRPWSIAENRELDLIEVPLLLMDCTPVKYMGLPREEGLARIRQVIQRTATAGGVFTMLWHNAPLIDPEYDGWYEAILDLLPAGQNFQLPESSSALW
ncbi:MAG TPA: polysaccharide deacetylase family protein [Candidatus Acidoferrum sp.]|nr:polysaccharide deacetylase family protein [Candidatus Acidoferrum sp.]